MKQTRIKAIKKYVDMKKELGITSKTDTRLSELSAMVDRMNTKQIVQYIYDLEIKLGYHI